MMGSEGGAESRQGNIFSQKIYNRGICFYISAIHLVLSLCYVTSLGLLGRGLPQQIWCCPDPSLLIITSMNIKQLFICTVYMHTTYYNNLAPPWMPQNTDIAAWHHVMNTNHFPPAAKAFPRICTTWENFSKRSIDILNWEGENHLVRNVDL